MGRVYKRTPAKRDLTRHFVWLGERNLATAERFAILAEQTFRELAEMPGMGSPGKLTKGRHSGSRLWRVRGFENYLIVYRPHRGGVMIERVVHAAEDYTRLS